MRKLFLASVVILTAFATSASASLITGELAFTGTFTPDSTPLSSATALTFPSAVVVGATGDLSAVTLGPVAFTGFTFSPGLIPSPVTLWSKDGFSFDMSSISTTEQTDTVVKLVGSGTLKGGGFTDTPGIFNFTGNTFGTLFSFSAGNTVVPEPTSMLVWSGLSMALLAARRQRRS